MTFFAFLNFVLQIAFVAAPLWRRGTAATKASAAVAPSSSASLMPDLTGAATRARTIKKAEKHKD